tara:strand:- start:186 stop:440 length:255 start_codon:yes stop_codon:yes gene_type:complete
MENIVQYPLSTEKVIRLMESGNTLAFVVAVKATKREIKKEIESLFKAKVAKINTMITPAGKKKAYVRFAADTPAIDIATKLGLI